MKFTDSGLTADCVSSYSCLLFETNLKLTSTHVHNTAQQLLKASTSVMVILRQALNLVSIP